MFVGVAVFAVMDVWAAWLVHPAAMAFIAVAQFVMGWSWCMAWHTQPTEGEEMKTALQRCVEVIENDVTQLRREGFEGASWQLDAIRKGCAALAADPIHEEGEGP